MSYVIIVEFRLKQGTRAEFRRLIDANAAASVRNEDGCLQFDVLEPEGEDDRVLLYEIYADRAAFDAHVLSEHFRTFARSSDPLCLQKNTVACRLAFAGAAGAAKAP